MRTILRTAAAALLVVGAIACAKKVQMHDELSAQSEGPSEDELESRMASQKPSASAEAPSAPEPAPSAATPTLALDVPTCPLDCRIQRPHLRALNPDEVARIQSALSPTMNGIRSCLYGEQGAASYIRPPPVNLRFSDQGDVLDLGIDSQGFEPSVESCLQSLAHENSTVPQVKLDSGAATVRCVERCERPAATKAPRRRAAPKR